MMYEKEMRLVIERLNKQLGYNKDQIIKWCLDPLVMGSLWTGTPKDYVDCGLAYLVYQEIDKLELKK